LVVQAAAAVKVAVRKVQHHLAVVATKEAANVVVNAEAVVVVTEEVGQVRVEINAAVGIVRVDQVARVAAQVVIVQAVTVRVDQVKDNNQSRDRHRLDIKA
jgi:hypothetical protein